MYSGKTRLFPHNALTFGAAILLFTVFSIQAQVPKWVESRSQDSATIMFGVGSATTIDEAKNMALVELAGKVNTQVTQLYQSHEEAINNELNSSVSIATRINVGATDLKYFYVNQTQQNGEIFWVEVALDKAKMAEDLNAQYVTKHESLVTKMGFYSEQSAFIQFLQSQSFLKEVEELIQLASQIKFFKPNFNSRENSALYNDYLKTILTAKTNKHVFLNDTKALPQVAKEFRTWLASRGVILMDVPSADADMIELSNNTESFQDKRNAYVAHLQTRLTVQSAVLGQIGHSTIKTKGRDYNRQEDALNKAVKSLKLTFIRSEPLQLLNIAL